MRRSLLFLLFVAACGSSAKAPLPQPQPPKVQPAPEVVVLPEAQRIATLVRVWGFLEVHHPSIVATDVDWDAALLEALRETREKPAGFAATLARLVERAGPVPAAGPASAATPATAWIAADRSIGAVLAATLEAIRVAARSDNKRVTAAADVGNPLFHTKGYPDAGAHPSVELRLLGLARYWNAINYFFPYRHQIDGDWSAVLTELAPRFVDAGDALAYAHAVAALAARVGDGHTFVVSDALKAARGVRRARVDLRFVEGETVVGVRNAPPGLAPGDIVTAIGGVPVADLRMRIVESASNESAREYFVGYTLLAANTDTVKLTIERAGALRDVEVPTGDKPPPKSKAPSWKKLANNVGYIDMASFQEDHIEPALKDLAKTRGIVFDMRAYPEFVLFKLLPHLKATASPFVKFTFPDMLHPGAVTDGDAPLEIGGGGPATVYAGRIAILVDESTMSRAEYVTMALQTVPRAIVVGGQTAGADGNVSFVELPGGVKVGMSGIGIYYPDGRPTQRTGLAIDIPAKPTLKGLREGRDEVLDRAIAALTAP